MRRSFPKQGRAPTVRGEPDSTSFFSPTCVKNSCTSCDGIFVDIGSSLHREVEGAGTLPAGVDHRHRPGARIAGIVERRIEKLAGVHEGSAVAGIGVALRIVVGQRGPALEVAAVDRQLLRTVRTGYRIRRHSTHARRGRRRRHCEAERAGTLAAGVDYHYLPCSTVASIVKRRIDQLVCGRARRNSVNACPGLW